MATYKIMFTEKAHAYAEVVAESAEDALEAIKDELDSGYRPECDEDPELLISVYSEGGDCLLEEYV